MEVVLRDWEWELLISVCDQKNGVSNPIIGKGLAFMESYGGML